MSDDRRAVTAVLLVAQCGLALLAALGLHVYLKLSNALAQLPGAELLAFAGPLVLLLLGIGMLRGSRTAVIGICAWEVLTLLGTAFSLLTSGGSGPVLTSGFTGVALPLGIVFLLTRGADHPRDGLLTTLLLATGCIHLALVPEHLTAESTLGRLFLLDGLAFLVLAYVRRTAFLRVALLVATIAAYFGVVLRGQEAVDDLGVATKLVELTALGLILWPRQASTFEWRSLAAGGTLLAAIVFSGGLTWAASFRSGEDGHAHAHAHAHVLAAAAPTDQQTSAAARLVDDTRNGIARFENLQAALADGYRPSTPATAPTVHYVNPKYARSGVVDPGHPQALVYANTPEGPRLLGAMFMMPGANQLPPDIGGSIAEWHSHPNLCFLPPTFVIDGLQSPFGSCPTGAINAPTPAMLHVWTVPNPAGPFGELAPAPDTSPTVPLKR